MFKLGNFLEAITAPIKNAVAQGKVEERKTLFNLAIEHSGHPWSANMKQVASEEYQLALSKGLTEDEMKQVIERRKLPMYLR